MGVWVESFSGFGSSRKSVTRSCRVARDLSFFSFPTVLLAWDEAFHFARNLLVFLPTVFQVTASDSWILYLNLQLVAKPFLLRYSFHFADKPINRWTRRVPSKNNYFEASNHPFDHQQQSTILGWSLAGLFYKHVSNEPINMKMQKRC